MARKPRICTKIYIIDGQKMTFNEILEKTGINKSTLHYRLDGGIDTIENLIEPVRNKKDRKNKNTLKTFSESNEGIGICLNCRLVDCTSFRKDCQLEIEFNKLKGD